MVPDQKVNAINYTVKRAILYIRLPKPMGLQLTQLKQLPA